MFVEEKQRIQKCKGDNLRKKKNEGERSDIEAGWHKQWNKIYI